MPIIKIDMKKNNNPPKLMTEKKKQRFLKSLRGGKRLFDALHVVNASYGDYRFTRDRDLHFGAAVDRARAVNYTERYVRNKEP
jgi:hypothetical protein